MKKHRPEKISDDASGDAAEHVVSGEKRDPRSNDETPTHREDFTRLLNAAAQKRELED
jgi:hypothetical protein